MRWTALALAACLMLAAPDVLAQTTSPPDYAEDSAWICRPGRNDACAVDLSVQGQTPGFSSRDDPAIDCFYVYPTISTAPGDSAPIAMTEDEARTVRLQLARLRSVCRLYAPLYRQLTVSDMKRRLEGDQTPDLPAAMALAEGDVASAWARYLEHDNAGRGVVLIGHSQGALILQGLIRDQIDGRPLGERLVSAVLPGSFVTAPSGQDVGGTFQAIPACRAKTQTGCVVVFNSFRAEAPPPEAYEGMLEAGERALCVNPASPAGGQAPLKAVFPADGRTIIPWFSAPPHVVAPGPAAFLAPQGLIGACVNEDAAGYLSIAQTDADDTFTLGGDFLFKGERDEAMGLHLIDLELVMGDLVDLIGAQGQAYLTRP